MNAQSRRLILVLAVLPLLGATGEEAGPARGPRVQECTTRVLSSSRLTTEHGHDLYVETTALVASGPNLLLAGAPSSIYPVGARLASFPIDSLLGVVLGREVRPRMIRLPFESRRLGSVRAAARGDGGWDVVFAETFDWPPEMGWPADSARHVWHGVLRPGGWASLDTIPLMAITGSRHWSSDSHPVRIGDTLYWAFVGSWGFRKSVSLLRLVEGRWAAERVPVQNALYVDIAAHPRAGLVMAVVASDPSIRHDNNSLFVFAGRPRWSVARKVAAGTLEPAFHPRLSRAGDAVDLTWMTQGERAMQARVVTDVAGPRPGRVLTIDPRLLSLYPAHPVVTGEQDRLWVSPHADSVRMTRIVGDSVHLVAQIPTPSEMTVRAAGWDGHRFAIVGWKNTPERTSHSVVVTAEAIGCGPAPRTASAAGGESNHPK